MSYMSKFAFSTTREGFKKVAEDLINAGYYYWLNERNFKIIAHNENGTAFGWDWVKETCPEMQVVFKTFEKLKELNIPLICVRIGEDVGDYEIKEYKFNHEIPFISIKIDLYVEK